MSGWLPTLIRKWHLAGSRLFRRSTTSTPPPHRSEGPLCEYDSLGL
ncbi:hypothetical protein DEU38_103210 [Rhodococcus sp. AG1013]|nr:hypothetical protein DEU38_103210 [Rhodococcus sp. AG1013]